MQLLYSNDADENTVPVVLLFLPGTFKSWLIGSISKEQPELAYGLFQMNAQFTLGQFNLTELASLKGPDLSVDYKGIVFEDYEHRSTKITRLFTFEGKYPLKVYLEVAREIGIIQTDDHINQEIWNKYSSFKIK
jgi:hypothetical protein